MILFTKIFRISKLTASSILKKRRPDSLLDSDLFSDSDKQYILDQLTDKKIIKDRSEMIRQINKKEGWKAIEQRIETPVRKANIWSYAAAAAIILFSAGIYFYEKNPVKSLQKDSNAVASKSVVVPGTDKAVLVLANGQQVILGKGAKYNSANVHSNGKEIIYSNNSDDKAEIAYNYLTIPRGGQFFIKLADGSKVWLNSESQLKFPTAFIDGKSREVELVYGEAYFDVSPSTAHKGSRFNVVTRTQNIAVLGTEFNVKAYQDTHTIATTLVEGKVSLSNSVVSRVLQPGDQSVMDINSNHIRIQSVDIYNEVSWREGVFSFKEMPLKDIMKVLERWYDIKTVFKRQSIQEITFNGILDKNQKIEEILAIISNTNKISYDINQKTVIFK